MVALIDLAIPLVRVLGFLGYATLSIYLVLLVGAIRKQLTHIESLEMCCLLGSRLGTLCTRTDGTQTPSEEQRLAGQVRRLGLSRRMQRAQQFIHIMTHVLALFLLWILVSPGNEGMSAWESDDPQDLAGNLVPTVCMLAFGVFFRLWPQYLSVTWLHGLHAILLMKFALAECFQLDIVSFLHEHQLYNIVRCVLCIAMGTPLSTLCYNTLYSVVTIRARSSHVVESSTVVAFCTSEVFMTMALFAIGACVMQWTRAEAEATVRAQIASHQTTTAHQLLSLLCDAVFYLSPELQLTEDSPHLSALLLRSLRSRVAFVDLAVEADRERLTRFIQEATPAVVNEDGFSVGVPGLLHVTLLDVSRTPVDVEIFRVRVTRVDQVCGYLIGVRDVSGQDAAMRGEAVDIGAGSAKAAQASLASFEDFQRNKYMQRPSSHGGSSSGADSCGEVPQLVPIKDATSCAGEADLAAIWVDTNDTSFRVKLCTLGFMMMTGPVIEGSGCIDWIVEADAVRDAVQECVNDEFTKLCTENDSLQPSSPMRTRLGKVTFRPPGLAAAGLEFHADLHLDLKLSWEVGGRWSKDFVDLSRVCLVFDHVSRRRIRKKRQTREAFPGTKAKLEYTIVGKPSSEHCQRGAASRTSL